MLFFLSLFVLVLLRNVLLKHLDQPEREEHANEIKSLAYVHDVAVNMTEYFCKVAGASLNSRHVSRQASNV